MAKTQKEEAVVELTTEKPKIDETVDKLKIKKPKIKKFTQPDEVIKVDLSAPPEQQVETEEVKTETSVIEEITEIEEVKTPEPPKTPDLPEGLEKVVNFMKDTGGDLNDYMRLNKDYGSLDDDELLHEYYKETKPHLNEEEIKFLVEDNYSWNEKLDDKKDVKRKKLALKEQVAGAKSHLDGLKSKYYEDLKMGSKLTSEQQDAIEAFNNYKAESDKMQKVQEEAKSTFLRKTDEVFNNEFKGFEYKVGDKRFRFNVSDTEKIKTSQSDINNFVRKFLNEKEQMENATGYHKSLFTAMNSDAIANHFYEQGKADALKESMAKSKNINMDPRQTHSEPIQSGVKVRVLNNDSNDFKFKIKSKK